jgi:prepilin-type N-terminal cleavage/methylation domain-containing protein
MIASLKQDAAGFTLLEVLVALTVLSVALLGLLGLATVAIKGNASSKMIASGTMLAQDKLEDMRRLGYNATLSSTTTVTEAFSSIAGYPLFQRVTVIQVNAPAAGMQTVTTTVSWNSPGNQFGSNSVTLTTVLTL